MRDRHDHFFRKAKAEGYLSRAAYKLMEIDDRRRIMHRGDWVLDCGCWPGGWLQVAAERVGTGGAVVGVDLEPIRHQFRQANVRTMQANLETVDPSAVLALAAEASRESVSSASEPRQNRDRPALSSAAAGAGISSGAASDDARARDREQTARHVERRFDVILSDMAPKTSGDHVMDHHSSARLCDLVLQLCPRLLRPGGSLVMKVFEGERYPDLLSQCRSAFKAVKGFKPKSSRSESREMYIVALEYAGSSAPGDRADVEPSPESATQRPPRPHPRPGW